MDAPNRLLEAAQEIQQFCQSRNWRFCFIGGIAVQRWGEARGAPEHEALEQALERSPPILVPTIVLHGENDRDNFAHTSAGKEAYFANQYERAVLPGVGHFVPREAPDRVLAAVRHLLS